MILMILRVGAAFCASISPFPHKKSSLISFIGDVPHGHFRSEPCEATSSLAVRGWQSAAQQINVNKSQIAGLK